MHVSLLSQDEFSRTIHQLDWRVRRSPFGSEVSLWNGDRLFALGFGEENHVKENLKAQFPSITSYGTSETRREAPLKIVLVGTPFQHKVWAALIEIPEGEKTTYQLIADKISNPRAVRAVGTAIGRNPISLYVPCHRVVRQDGKMGGYRWGLDIKQKILGSELNAKSL